MIFGWRPSGAGRGLPAGEVQTSCRKSKRTTIKPSSFHSPPGINKHVSATIPRTFLNIHEKRGVGHQHNASYSKALEINLPALRFRAPFGAKTPAPELCIAHQRTARTSPPTHLFSIRAVSKVDQDQCYHFLSLLIPGQTRTEIQSILAAMLVDSSLLLSRVKQHQVGLDM